MSTQVKHRRGSNAEIIAGTPAVAELWFNTSDNSFHAGDGVKLGGHKIAKVSTIETLTTVAEIASGIFNLAGTRLKLTDRADAIFKVVSGGSPDGYGVLDAGNGNTAEIIIEGSIYNIIHFGAVDAAPDNTGPMQATATAAGVGGGIYYEPVGLWIHGQIDIKDSTIMMGCGFESRDQRLSDFSNPVVTQVGYRFFGIQGIAPYPPEENVKNITCYQINFLGTVETDGFQEFKHLMMMQGATNVDIQTCWFTGWQGDAIVIRSGNFTAAAQNLNVKIKDTVFDGINNDNRNAISITDVYGMTIRDNKFKNCTRSDMPGAIDIEPNTLDTYVVLNDIYIGHNNFNNIGGNVACVGMTMPIATEAFDDEPPRNMTVEHNVMDGVFTGWRFSQVQNFPVIESFTPLNVKVFNNTVTDATERPFWMFGIRGLKSSFNHYERCAKAGAIGWLNPATQGCDNIKLHNDTFRHCGTTDGSAIALYTASNISLKELTFDNVGVTGGGFGVPITFADGVNSKIKVENSDIINNEGLTTGVFSIVGGATITPGNNTLKGNDFLGFDTSAFPADFTDFGETSFETGITALAGGQAGAAQLTSAMNVVSGGAAFDSVKLPTATGDAREITISNTTAGSIQVYPFSGDNLGKGLNAPESLATGTSRTYKTYDNNNWIRTTS
tara:strand:+ start:29994 stop:31997 length:2004 start_codon:yes stop_codon:yes gene_type:complete